jgi:two-component system sensor histidine kinase YesM
VQDDGVGLTPYKLAQIQETLKEDTDEISLKEGGFGLENVNKRIKLYYGKQYGVTIQSHYQTGTLVSIVIPAQDISEGQRVEEKVL